MKNALSLAVAILVGSLLVGCGSQPGSSGDRAASGEKNGPEYTVFRFLEAVRLGNAQQTSAQLTPLAKEKTSQYGQNVAPPGSETASFRVGKVRRTPDGTAWVACQWTDLNGQGKPHTDEMTWKVVQVNGKWLIAGMSAQLAADQPPVLMDFEDPETMIRHHEQLAAEANGRSDSELLEARKEDPFKSAPK